MVDLKLVIREVKIYQLRELPFYFSYGSWQFTGCWIISKGLMCLTLSSQSRHGLETRQTTMICLFFRVYADSTGKILITKIS